MPHSSAAFLAEISILLSGGAYSIHSAVASSPIGWSVFPASSIVLCFFGAALSVYRALLKGA